MTEKKLVSAITELDGDILDRYFVMKQDLERKKKLNKRIFIKWVSLAACVALIISVVIPKVRKDGFAGLLPSNNSSFGNDSPGIYQTTFDFDTYEDMIRAFRKSDFLGFGDTINGLKSVLGEEYTYFVDKVNKNRAFPRPMINNEEITYRNREGFSNIIFLVSELYGLPWVWYFPVYNGQEFSIRVTYLPESIADENLTASEAIKAIAPDAINIDNTREGYENVYNKHIKLADREVTAMICELKADTENIIAFVYGDVLVNIKYDPEKITEQWFSELSFK